MWNVLRQNSELAGFVFHVFINHGGLNGVEVKSIPDLRVSRVWMSRYGVRQKLPSGHTEKHSEWVLWCAWGFCTGAQWDSSLVTYTLSIVGFIYLFGKVFGSWGFYVFCGPVNLQMLSVWMFSHDVFFFFFFFVLSPGQP